MEVRFNTNSQVKPSFGMAKLTKQGAEVAKQFLGDIPKLADGGALSVKNMTLEIIKEAISEEGVKAGELLDGFFKQGASDFAIDNATFVKKQILPTRSFHAIKKFLKQQCADATPKKSPLDTTKQTPMGKKVIGHMVDIFDKNIANKNLSRKQCQKVLKLAEPYMEACDVSPRVTVVSGKLYSK